MDARRNPYAPGAGTPPPELAGRDPLIEQVDIALDRIRAGLSARSIVLYGLRGVGKTVLLNRLYENAEDKGFAAAILEAPEKRSLPSLLIPALRSILLRISRKEQAKHAADHAMQVLANFIKSMQVSYQDITINLDLPGIEGLADSGDLDLDLQQLLQAVGKAAKARQTTAVLYIDEMQYIELDELSALIGALHVTAQRQLPITLIGAGLPQILGRMGKAKSYAERLFKFVKLDTLEEEAAISAIIRPAEHWDVKYTEDAVVEILTQAHGYPYFLQVWGRHCWDIAESSPITKKDVISATETAYLELDSSFFLVRFDRLTPSEKRYLRAMAELGPGPHRSGDIAQILKKRVDSVAPLRNVLISKGMIYSPAHGDTAFTVPLFDGFMKRIIPTLEDS